MSLCSTNIENGLVMAKPRQGLILSQMRKLIIEKGNYSVPQSVCCLDRETGTSPQWDQSRTASRVHTTAIDVVNRESKR